MGLIYSGISLAKFEFAGVTTDQGAEYSVVEVLEKLVNRSGTIIALHVSFKAIVDLRFTYRSQ